METSFPTIGGSHLPRVFWIYGIKSMSAIIRTTWVTPTIEKLFAGKPPGNVPGFFLVRAELLNVRFSNRPIWVKRFQTVYDHSVDVTHGLVLLFGIGTKAPIMGFENEVQHLLGGLVINLKTAKMLIDLVDTRVKAAKRAVQQGLRHCDLT